MTKTKHQTAEFIEIERSQILNAPYNPRSIAPANRKRLTRSLKTHGLVDAPVWNKRTGHIVGGHQRVAILDDLEGSREYSLTVQQVDISEDDEMTLNLALNNKSLQGQFESDLLKEIFSDMIDRGIDIEHAGYSTTDVQTMYPDINIASAIADQQQAEADMVAEISNMVQSGKAHEQEFRERMGLGPTGGNAATEGSAAVNQDNASESPDQSESTGVKSAEQSPGRESPEHEARGWTQPKEYFQDKRQGVLASNEVKSQTDTLLTLAFSSTEQLLAFCDAFGIDKETRYLGAFMIEEAFGVQLPKVTA